MTLRSNELTAEPVPAELSGAELAAPAVVGGRYALGLVIGRGGMSTVYEAADRRTGQRVAVKVFRPGVDSRVHRLDDYGKSSSHRPFVTRASSPFSTLNLMTATALTAARSW
jgi:hypothetical protein